MTDVQKKILLDWMRKIHQLEYAHAYESIKWSRTEYVIGISAFIISALIACSYRFPSISHEEYISLPFYFRHDFVIPFATTILTILTGLQTFLKPSNKSETYRKSGISYEKLRHKIEPLFAGKYSEWEVNQHIENIRKEWERMDTMYVSPKNFNKGKNKAQRLKKYPEELGFLPTIQD